jgi:TRAP-type C4-dicarboxylate transport system substrate-binding protein
VVVNGWTSRDDPDEERTVLQDLADGVADVAWIGARAVGAVFGIRSLEPLQAPLLFPDEKTVRRFLAATQVPPLLEPLKEFGLEGLALLPGGLRRPFGITGPLLGAEDWQGKVIRTHASLSGEAAICLLGATPVLRSAATLSSGPPPGVDGMDLDSAAVATWRYSGWLTSNVPLWPRLLLLVANRRRLERLASSNRSALREAARRSFVEAVTRPSATDRQLPDSVKLIKASGDQLALLRDRIRPLHDQLRSTSQGERTLGKIEQHIAATYRVATTTGS